MQQEASDITWMTTIHKLLDLRVSITYVKVNADLAELLLTKATLEAS